MGQDKALLSWQGTPLIAHLAHQLHLVTDTVYLFTPWPERYQAVLGNRVQFVREARPGGGPVAALQQFLAVTNAWDKTPDWVLVVACDLPCLDPVVLRQWRDRATAAAPEILALVPRWQNRWEPLCAFYRPAIAPLLTPDNSFQKLLPQLKVDAIVLTPEVGRMLQNCNTPEDFATLEQQARAGQ
jgi:molybdopterin-guanine dinucleotide biosynthesis protein A